MHLNQDGAEHKVSWRYCSNSFTITLWDTTRFKSKAEFTAKTCWTYAWLGHQGSPEPLLTGALLSTNIFERKKNSCKKKLFLLNHKRKDCKDIFQNLFSFQTSQPSESTSLSNCVSYLQMCHSKGNKSCNYWIICSISGNTIAVSFGKLTKEVST